MDSKHRKKISEAKKFYYAELKRKGLKHPYKLQKLYNGRKIEFENCEELIEKFNKILRTEGKITKEYL